MTVCLLLYKHVDDTEIQERDSNCPEFMQIHTPWQPQPQCQEAPLQWHHLVQEGSLQPILPAKANNINPQQ